MRKCILLKPALRQADGRSTIALSNENSQAKVQLNKIYLYLDKRFWLAVSHKGHRKIESEPEWAYEQGFSIRSNQKLDK